MLIATHSAFSQIIITPVPGSPIASLNNALSGPPRQPLPIGLNYSPNGKWLANANDVTDGPPDYVSMYTVDFEGTGALTTIPGPGPAPYFPFKTTAGHSSSAAYSPDNKFLLVSCSQVQDIALDLYSVDQSTGAPTIITNYPLDPSIYQLSPVIYSPNGKFVAAANATQFSISGIAMYQVQNTGLLNLVGNYTRANYDLSESQNATAFSPDSMFIAQANGNGFIVISINDFTFTIYEVDQTSGTLLNPVDYQIPFMNYDYYASSVAYSPDGKFLAVADTGSNIYMYTLNNGIPTLASTIQASQSGGSGNRYPSSLAFSPDSQFITVTNQAVNPIFVFSVDALGNMTPFGSPLPSGGNLLGLAFSPINSQGAYFLSAPGALNVTSYKFAPVPNPPNSLTGCFTPVGNTITITLSWTPPSSGPTPAHYEIFSDPFLYILVATVPGTTLSYDITGLTPNQTYTYYVVSVDGLGNKSTPVSVTVTDADLCSPIKPSPPTNGMGTPKTNIFLSKTECILAIKWTASISSDVVSYNIYNGSTLVGSVLATSPQSFCALISCCDNGKNFSITAVNSAGQESVPTPVMVLCK